jgi:hypothetical protein
MRLSVIPPIHHDMTPIPENIGRICELHAGMAKETIGLDAHSSTQLRVTSIVSSGCVMACAVSCQPRTDGSRTRGWSREEAGG